MTTTCSTTGNCGSVNKTQCAIMTVLRIALGAAMLFYGVAKLGNLPGVIDFLGGAAHQIGLTFLSTTVWGWLAVVGEIVAGILLVFGCTKTKKIGALLTIIIMIVAAGGGHGWTIAGGAGKAYAFAVVALAILVVPGGKCLIDAIKGLTNKGSCNKGSCSTKNKKNDKNLEIIEA